MCSSFCLKKTHNKLYVYVCMYLKENQKTHPKG